MVEKLETREYQTAIKKKIIAILLCKFYHRKWLGCVTFPVADVPFYSSSVILTNINYNNNSK